MANVQDLAGLGKPLCQRINGFKTGMITNSRVFEVDHNIFGALFYIKLIQEVGNGTKKQRTVDRIGIPAIVFS